MVKIANKNGSEYTTDKDEFRGSNTFAEWNEGKYIVYSYGRHFPMYVYKASTQTGMKIKINIAFQLANNKHSCDLIYLLKTLFI